MFISVRNDDHGTADSACRLSALSRAIQAEMSQLIKEEADKYNVKCYHLITSEYTNESTAGAQETGCLEKYGIASCIINLYKKSSEKEEAVVSTVSNNN